MISERLWNKQLSVGRTMRAFLDVPSVNKTSLATPFGDITAGLAGGLSVVIRTLAVPAMWD